LFYLSQAVIGIFIPDAKHFGYYNIFKAISEKNLNFGINAIMTISEGYLLRISSNDPTLHTVE
jgi:hypothetical protein